MNRPWLGLLAACAVALCGPGLSWAAGASASRGQVEFPGFDALRTRASESVDITLDAAMLGIAARFMSAGDPGDAEALAAIRGLTGIYVRSYTFEGPWEFPATDVARLRAQLAGPPWQRVLQSHSAHDGSDVEIHVASDGQRPLGLAIIAWGPREFTVVNLVGPIDLEHLHAVEGHLGVPRVQQAPAKAAAPKPGGHPP